jgi:hypothetical protein
MGVDRLAVAGPRRHGHTDRGKWLTSEAIEARPAGRQQRREGRCGDAGATAYRNGVDMVAMGETDVPGLQEDSSRRTSPLWREGPRRRTREGTWQVMVEEPPCPLASMDSVEARIYALSDGSTLRY